MQIAFHTLGCKLNFAETSTLRRVAEEAGYSIVSFDSVADIYVINTCTVTEKTDKKCRNAIRKAIRKNPVGKVIVTGCFAELKPDEVNTIDGVSLIIGNNEKVKFLQYISLLGKRGTQKTYIDENLKNEFFNAFSIGDRTRSFLKVQDGCNYFCSYCTIPFARGRSRNAPISELVKEAEYLASKNIHEIVLTGINIGDFGHSTHETFFQLIQELEKVEGIDRYRMSSIEPDLLTDEIVKFVSVSKKFMPHFHIPLQSGSDSILKKMNRKYCTDHYRKKIESILKIIPGVSIGTDVIVGFPGEGEKEFIETFTFLKSLDLSYLHVFSYSERENTASEKYSDKVKDEIKNERSRILHDLSEEKKKNFYQKIIGDKQIVLFESRTKDGKMYGFTENYVKVETSLQKKYFNTLIPVELITFDNQKQCIIGKISE
jgi:threonylcarbamoyladenosine tRNA methylthiotransferase MtaB